MDKNCICPLRRACVLLVALIMLSAVCPAQAGRKSGSSEWKKKVTVVEWFHGGRSALRKGHCGYVYDIKSGKTIRVKRLGGHNHMDLEPADRASGAVMKKLGKSWNPRPAILYPRCCCRWRLPTCGPCRRYTPTCRTHPRRDTHWWGFRKSRRWLSPRPRG